jgi:hypothetical protein
MGAKADDRYAVLSVGRERRIDVAEFIQMGVGDADLPQLLDEEAAQVFLLLGR